MHAPVKPQPAPIGIVDRHEARRFIGHAELIEAARRAHDGFGLDALNDAEPVVRVNDLVANLECHVTPGL